MIEDAYPKMIEALTFYANGDHITLHDATLSRSDTAELAYDLIAAGKVEIEDGKVARDYLALIDRELPLEPFQGSVRVWDWINSQMFIKDANLAYAIFCFEIWGLPAWKYYNFDTLPEVMNLELYCDYRKTPESKPSTMRVTGAGSMGDVWLRKDFKFTDGYDYRVEVTSCSNWRRTPTVEQSVQTSVV